MLYHLPFKSYGHLKLFWKKKKNVFVNHECPYNDHFFENWHWYLTLTDDLELVINRKVLLPGILMSNMKALTVTNKKNMANVKVFADKQAKNCMSPIYQCGDIQKK